MDTRFRGDPRNWSGAGSADCAQIQGGYLSDYRGGAGAAGGSKGNQRAQGDGDCGSGE